jgi:hypothetical protein
MCVRYGLGRQDWRHLPSPRSPKVEKLEPQSRGQMFLNMDLSMDGMKVIPSLLCGSSKQEPL